MPTRQRGGYRRVGSSADPIGAGNYARHARETSADCLLSHGVTKGAEFIGARNVQMIAFNRTAAIAPGKTPNAIGFASEMAAYVL